MVESGRLPGGRVVTDRAVMREVLRGVIGIVRSVEVRRMAGIAIRRRIRKLSVGMALSALQVGMRTGQRKSHKVVIKRRRLPGGCRVALRTIVRKIPRGVIRIGGILKVHGVAGIAVRRRARVTRLTVVGMALRARHIYVGTCQRKSGEIVIEGRRLPAAGRMADCAVVTEIPAHMIGIGRVLKTCLMAGIAVRSHAGIDILTVDQMAGIAGRGCVRSRQSKSGYRMIDKIRILPFGHRNPVALRAVVREPRRHVAGIIGLLKRLQMAA